MILNNEDRRLPQYSAADCETMPIASGAATMNLICGLFDPHLLISPAQAQISQSLLTSAATHKIDALQAAIERMPQVELPLTHRFIPGMYIRTIFMPAGALVISKIHRTQHPFVVTKGRCLVWAANLPASTLQRFNASTLITAPHIGITMPGTRRILYIYEDTEWTTFHATDKTTPEAVEADIIEPHDFDREEAQKLFAAEIAKNTEEMKTKNQSPALPLTESPVRAADGSQGSSATLGARPPLVTPPRNSAADCEAPR